MCHFRNVNVFDYGCYLRPVGVLEKAQLTHEILFKMRNSEVQAQLSPIARRKDYVPWTFPTLPLCLL